MPRLQPARTPFHRKEPKLAVACTPCDGSDGFILSSPNAVIVDYNHNAFCQEVLRQNALVRAEKVGLKSAEAGEEGDHEACGEQEGSPLQ